jgi:hypothetical protein
MAQQEAPEVGAVIDGYRFKGGDPKQEASWEQTEPLPAPEYGQGAMRLPNGAVVRYGPRGGMDTIVSAAQATAAGNGSESSPMVGADARARFMINLGPLQAAQDNMERMDREGYNPSSFQNAGAAALEVVPFDAGFAARIAGGEDYNAYNQAAKTFEAAILPIMSGAAVTPTEAQRLIRAALPQPGDSPEVLAQKSEQRRMMINAVAQGIGQSAPYDANDPNNLRIRDLLPDETPEALAASGRVRGADGVWRYPRDDQGNPIFPEDGGGPPPTDGGGVDGSARPGSGGEAAPAMGAIEARTADQGIGRRADTFVRGIADAATFGLSDEITAGLNTIAPLDRGTRGGWNGDWGGAYRQNLDLMRGIDEADAEQMPLTRGAGQLVGAVGGGVGTARLAPQILRQAPRLARSAPLVDRVVRGGQNAARLAAGGGAAGAAYGFGSSEGDLGERADDAAMGGVLGAVAAPVVGAAARPVVNNVLAPAGRVIARPIAALGERFGVPGAAEASRRLAPNVLEGAVDRYGARFNPDAGVLAQRADERAAQGLETTFVDLMDEGQRGLGRALATRQTPARQAVREFAEGRAERLPDRMAMQARRTMSNDPRSPAEIRDQLAASGRREAEPLYREAYSRQIEPSPVIDEMLSRPAGRAALQKAYTIARNEGRNPNELGMFVSTREAGSPAASSRLPADPELFADLDAMRAGRRTQGPARGESLLEFISKNGGVRDDGGDLAAIGADAWNRQGAWRSRAVRDDGLSLEQMADRARAAGYFDDVADATADSADNYQRISSQDMARAIDAELRGNPRFARAVGDTDRSANAALRSSRRNALEERLNREGIDISRASNADIARALRDADDAEARAVAFMEGDSPGPQVELIPGETPSMQTLDYVKRGFDDVLEGSRNATGQLVLDTNGRAVQQLRRDYRAELDRLNPAYAAARASHASASQLQRATELGENFLSMEADEFSRQASRLNPAEREVAVAAARRAVERGAGTQGAAPGVAQRLSSGREQNMRNAALLENPIPMQDAMRAEREGVMAARAVYPGSGSITSQAVSDQAQAGMNVLSAGANAVTGNVRGTVGALGRLVRLGYSDQEANALMTAAIDPNRTREVIDMLATRMNRQDARSMLRAIRFSASRGAGEYAGDEE